MLLFFLWRCFAFCRGIAQSSALYVQEMITTRDQFLQIYLLQWWVGTTSSDATCSPPAFRTPHVQHVDHQHHCSNQFKRLLDSKNISAMICIETHNFPVWQIKTVRSGANHTLEDSCICLPLKILGWQHSHQQNDRYQALINWRGQVCSPWETESLKLAIMSFSWFSMLEMVTSRKKFGGFFTYIHAL